MGEGGSRLNHQDCSRLPARASAREEWLRGRLGARLQPSAEPAKFEVLPAGSFDRLPHAPPRRAGARWVTIPLRL